MTRAETYKKAAAYLAERELCKGTLAIAGGNKKYDQFDHCILKDDGTIPISHCCLAGAVLAVSGTANHVYHDHHEWFGEQAPEFNDRPETTKEMVIERLLDMSRIAIVGAKYDNGKLIIETKEIDL